MLAKTVNNIINTNKERKLKKIQNRVNEMSEQWWKEYFDKVYEMIQYYQYKPDGKAREKVISLEMKKMVDIGKAYRNIVKQYQNNADFDVDAALQDLKCKIAVYDDDIAKWKKSFCHYKDSEKYNFGD